MATDDSSSRYVLLDELAEEFAARYRRGERPSLHEYVDCFPHLADDIRKLFPAMAEIEQLKEGKRRAGVPPFTRHTHLPPPRPASEPPAC